MWLCIKMHLFNVSCGRKPESPPRSQSWKAVSLTAAHRRHLPIGQFLAVFIKPKGWRFGNSQSLFWYWLFVWYKGTSALILTSTEVDQTGGSYYGEQSLQFISTNGDSNMVVLRKYSIYNTSNFFIYKYLSIMIFISECLAKKGPIYAMDRNPNSTQFCVVYGCILRYALSSDPCSPMLHVTLSDSRPWLRSRQLGHSLGVWRVNWTTERLVGRVIHESGLGSH
jgi:hypothetical protein